jgi:hypothetical protein
MDDLAVASIFDRVPDRIFRPLGTPEHSRRNWLLISHLYNDFFAPEADPPEGEGWTQKRITASIERFLLRWDDDHEIDPEEQSNTLNIRAYTAFKSLIESEWLTIDRVGFIHYVIMPPTVQSLFELLKTFAEQGPEFISGRVQSIRNNLNQVRTDPEFNAAVFQVAAKECSALLQMLNTTRMRVREASEHLRRQETTHIFLERFFGDYISSLYIGDYSDLFSRNHPLTARWEIIDLVLQISEEPSSRTKLRNWYRKNLRCRNDEEADHLIDADTARVLALRDVDKLLARLKDAVTKANDQALGYLEYKVRSQGNLDLWINQTIDALIRAADSIEEDIPIPIGWSHGKLFSEEILRPPTARPQTSKGAVIKKHELSPEARARRLVRQIMKGHREISETKIIAYISRHIPPGEALESSAMSIESINDLCILATLSRLGLIAERARRNSSQGIVRAQPYRELYKYIDIELTGDRFENAYLEAPIVKIRRRNAKGDSYAR